MRTGLIRLPSKFDCCAALSVVFICPPLATQIELLRADIIDPYGRTLGYLFLNGQNYSVLVVGARLAAESVSHYGDNGFPDEAEAVLAGAARNIPD